MTKQTAIYATTDITKEELPNWRGQQMLFLLAQNRVFSSDAYCEYVFDPHSGPLPLQ